MRTAIKHHRQGLEKEGADIQVPSTKVKYLEISVWYSPHLPKALSAGSRARPSPPIRHRATHAGLEVAAKSAVPCL